MPDKWDSLEAAPSGNAWDKLDRASSPGISEDDFNRLSQEDIQRQGGQINRARVAGTAALQGITDILNIPSDVLAAAGPMADLQLRVQDWVRKRLGLEAYPEGFKKEVVSRAQANGQSISDALNVKAGLEKVGLPTDYESEAKRLKVDTSGATGDILEGIRFASAGMASGAGPVGSALMGVGAGTAKAVGVAPEIGALVAPFAGARAVTPKMKTTEEALFNTAKRLYDAGRNGPPLSATEMQGLQLASNSVLRSGAMGGPLPAFNPLVHPRTAEAVDLLNQYATRGVPVSVPEFLTMKAGMEGNFSAPINPARQTMGADEKGDKLLLTQIMKLVDEKSPGAIKAADSMIRAAKVSQDLGRLEQTARTRAPDLMFSLRNEAASLVNNPRKMNFFTDAEEARLNSIVGSQAYRVLRKLGAVAPSGGLARTAGATLLGGEIYRETGDTKLAVLPAVMAEASKLLATAILRRRLGNMAQDVRNFGVQVPTDYGQAARTLPATITESNQ